MAQPNDPRAYAPTPSGAGGEQPVNVTLVQQFIDALVPLWNDGYIDSYRDAWAILEPLYASGVLRDPRTWANSAPACAECGHDILRDIEREAGVSLCGVCWYLGLDDEPAKRGGTVVPCAACELVGVTTLVDPTTATVAAWDVMGNGSGAVFVCDACADGVAPECAKCGGVGTVNPTGFINLPCSECSGVK